jgi:protein SCO1
LFIRKQHLYWILPVIPLAFLAWYFLRSEKEEPLKQLPYFGAKGTDPRAHQVPGFVFTDHYGKTVTESDVKGKVYVTEFFFTTCKTICPVMNGYLDNVYDAFRNDKDFLILSHTVDPETDSVAQLRRFAEIHGVGDRRWLFLTGDKPSLYRLARKGYLLSVDEGNGGEEDFIHTQNFALVDGDRRIRGFYDGTDSLQIAEMTKDIRTLLIENAMVGRK